MGPLPSKAMTGREKRLLKAGGYRVLRFSNEDIVLTGYQVGARSHSRRA